MAQRKAAAPRKGGQKRPPGRPTVYTKQKGDTICRRLISGQSLRTICSDAKMPHLSTVCGWLADPTHPFSEQYARAREVQAELFADEIVEISDGPLAAGGSGRPEDNVAVQRDRLRADNRKWVASRLLRHRYGEKVDFGLGGGALGDGVEVTMRVIRPDGKEEEA